MRQRNTQVDDFAIRIKSLALCFEYLRPSPYNYMIQKDIIKMWVAQKCPYTWLSERDSIVCVQCLERRVEKSTLNFEKEKKDKKGRTIYLHTTHSFLQELHVVDEMWLLSKLCMHAEQELVHKMMPSTQKCTHSQSRSRNSRLLYLVSLCGVEVG